eukprot:12535988-Ditylum_brightwellii.AAC.1
MDRPATASDNAKIHAIEDHLLEQMTLFGEIRCYIEDFIEKLCPAGYLPHLSAPTNSTRPV